MEVKQVIENLEKNGFEVKWADTKEAAKELLLNRIGVDKSVGAGGSMSVKELGILPALEDKGCAVYTHWGVAPEEAAAMRAKANAADVYLCSANAITRDGRLVFIDGGGNRVGAVCYGSDAVYFICGVNKLVDGGTNTAIARIKQVTCPLNARRLGLDTSCARTGKCSPDCDNSMCRFTLTVDRVPRGRQMTVVLVGEEVGY